MMKKESTIQGHRGAGSANTRAALCGLVFALTFFFATTVALGQEPEHPLKPLDRSSPRAALKTFLDTGDAIGTVLARDYIPSPSRAEFHRLASMGDHLVQGLDLSQVPPASRAKVGTAAATALYETLNRIQLPPLAEIPDTDQLGGPDSADATLALY